MDVSELRKRILRSLDEARKDAAEQRVVADDAARAYGAFLEDIAIPLFRQAAQVLVANSHAFTVHSPAGHVRLVADGAPETFLEIELERDGARTGVVGRVSVARGRRGQVVDESRVGGDKGVAELTEEDLSAYLVTSIPKLVLKP